MSKKRFARDMPILCDNVTVEPLSALKPIAGNAALKVTFSDA